MIDYQFIKVSKVDRVATIAFNSPTTRNALKQQMRLEIIDAVQRVEDDEDVRIIVLTGEGKGFCAGADLSEGMPGYSSFVDQCAAEYAPWLMVIHNSEKLYLAAVNGAAAGIGAAIVLNCDMVIMADDAYLYQAFSAIGLIPDGGATWLLLQKLGYQRAIDLAVNAGKLNASECLEVGLTNRVVSSNRLIDEAHQWAAEMAQGAPLAQAAVKRLMRKEYSMTYLESLNQEAVEQSKLIRSQDSANAVAAFFTKEKVTFHGK